MVALVVAVGGAEGSLRKESKRRRSGFMGADLPFPALSLRVTSGGFLRDSFLREPSAPLREPLVVGRKEKDHVNDGVHSLMTENRYPPFGILLVDDEPAWLRSLSLTLESSAGITNTILCQDSREVPALLEGGGIGLVLLDLTMPHLSGEELLKQIAERHPEVAVIVISGLNQVETAVRCMKAGAFDYFVKTDEEDRLVGEFSGRSGCWSCSGRTGRCRAGSSPAACGTRRPLPVSSPPTGACFPCSPTSRQWP